MRGWFSFFITRCGLTAYFYTGSDSSGTGLYLVLGFIRFLFIRFLFRAGVLYYTSCRRTYLSEGADLFWPQDSPSVRMYDCTQQVTEGRKVQRPVGRQGGSGGGTPLEQVQGQDVRATVYDNASTYRTSLLNSTTAFAIVLAAGSTTGSTPAGAATGASTTTPPTPTPTTAASTDLY
jgi:hypothetical protein